MDEQYEEFFKRLRDVANAAIELEPCAAAILFTLTGTLLSKYQDDDDRYLRQLSQYAGEISQSAIDGN